MKCNNQLGKKKKEISTSVEKFTEPDSNFSIKNTFTLLRQEVSRCCTREIHCMQPVKNAVKNEGIHPDFETQGRCH